MADPRPLVSVVVAAYDCERYIAATLDSALAQDYEPLEVIVVDDGSTDATAAIVERYDVRLIGRANGGQGAAKNTGVAAARGSLIAFLDHDDLWAPRKIARQVEALGAAPEVAGVVARLEVLLEPGVPHPPWLPRSREYPWFPPSSWLVRREAFDAVGAFDEQSSVPDFDWMLRARDLGHTFAIVPEVLGRYRIHGGNASYRREAVAADGFVALRRSLDRIRSGA
ncbi:MAG: glycosyltransferase [Actinomycetota bacterium]|nr:glycosyltransferase [Actinomycetota bacterium]